MSSPVQVDKQTGVMVVEIVGDGIGKSIRVQCAQDAWGRDAVPVGPLLSAMLARIQSLEAQVTALEQGRGRDSEALRQAAEDRESYTEAERIALRAVLRWRDHPG